MDLFFQYLGGVLCIVMGIFVTGLLIGLVTEYTWGKIKSASSIITLSKAVRAWNKLKKNNP